MATDRSKLAPKFRSLSSKLSRLTEGIVIEILQEHDTTVSNSELGSLIQDVLSAAESNIYKKYEENNGR